MLFIYSKNGCLKPLTLSAVGNDDRMLRNKFAVVCKCPGDGTLLTVKCPAPGTHRETSARGLPGGMLAVGIDLHIRVPKKSSMSYETQGCVLLDDVISHVTIYLYLA